MAFSECCLITIWWIDTLTSKRQAKNQRYHLVDTNFAFSNYHWTTCVFVLACLVAMRVNEMLWLFCLERLPSIWSNHWYQLLRTALREMSQTTTSTKLCLLHALRTTICFLFQFWPKLALFHYKMLKHAATLKLKGMMKSTVLFIWYEVNFDIRWSSGKLALSEYMIITFHRKIFNVPYLIIKGFWIFKM